MLFNSLGFLLFFPVVTLAYFVLPRAIRKYWLLVASYYFYMSWNPQYALLIAASTLITFASGLLIEKAGEDVSAKKLWVALSFGSNLAILVFFKYCNFLVDTLNTFMGSQITSPAANILLPVGISFYTFQALSYTMDVYRGEIKAEKNLPLYALFVSFFPQLVAGPIERSKNLLGQMYENHSFDWDRVKAGLSLMLWGYFEKLVIADRAAVLVNQVFDNYQGYAALELALAAVLFTVQIYCDFGGYSHIAIGAAQVMGFRLMDNFRQPYFALSIPDFWRRWHISLSSWFRDYLYIPLGGNRKGTTRKYLNIMLVFLTSGLWHGASWTYVIWGGLHGLYQVVGALLAPVRRALIRAFHIKTDVFSFRLLKRTFTFALVVLAYIFFRASTIGQAFGYIGRMLTATVDTWALFDGTLYTLGLAAKEFWLLMAAIGVLFWVDLKHEQGVRLRQKLEEQNLVFRWGIYLLAAVAVIVLGSYGPSYDASAFIYFQF